MTSWQRWGPPIIIGRNRGQEFHLASVEVEDGRWGVTPASDCWLRIPSLDPIALGAFPAFRWSRIPARFHAVQVC